MSLKVLLGTALTTSCHTWQAALAKSLTEEILDACLEVGSQVNEDARGRDLTSPQPLVNVSSIPSGLRLNSNASQQIKPSYLA